MKHIWAVLGWALLAVGACSDASPQLSCGIGTVAIDDVCLPGGAGSEAAVAGSSGNGHGAAAGMTSDAGASEEGGGATVSAGSSGAAGSGDSTGGAADAGAAGSEAVAGASPSSCASGPIECASGVALAASGKFTTSGSSDLVALDDTTFLVGNHVANRLDIFDLCSGTVHKSWPLPTKPDDIAFDANTRTAYVALRGQSAIAQIMLDSTGVILIALPKPALALTIGNRGRVFARLDDQSALPKSALSIIDGGRAVVLSTIYDDFQPLIAYDHQVNRLITGSDAGLNTFAFHDATDTLSFVERNSNTGGGNCRQLVLSPNERHIVLTCGGGNSVGTASVGYQIVDVDPAHLGVFFGLYNIGYYPDPAAFSPGGEYFYGLGDGQVLVFRVATHARIGAYPLRTDQLSTSPSGRVLLSRAGSADVSIFNWIILREASDCQ